MKQLLHLLHLFRGPCRWILQTNLEPHSSQKWAGAWHWILHSQVAMLLLFNPPGNISRFSRGIGIGYVSHGKNYCPNIVFCSRSLWSIIWKIVFFFKQKAVEQCFDDLYLKNPQISKQHICKTICMMYRFLEVLKLYLKPAVLYWEISSLVGRILRSFRPHFEHWLKLKIRFREKFF